ncbi:MAG: Sec-independent protein translocase protein TatA [candidate division CPR1 bacterium GW2011_GWC1_49_13]|uniref:Sec-independent protein translocase protein TatA n=1 Tax=candidate division CPR1 bacterium GW2011_GWC1_49_13 TaxID=1618342 RepID=A0A0G1XTW6_9BACT|nr:MAG: Sec-independent protein translocase protein TatA [candidate division CPR1 bacterium GW2011_GWC1_49_13]
MIGGLGTTELVFLSAVLMVFFGGRKLPELARGIGDSVREFRKAIKEG